MGATGRGTDALEHDVYDLDVLAARLYSQKCATMRAAQDRASRHIVALDRLLLDLRREIGEADQQTGKQLRQVLEAGHRTRDLATQDGASIGTHEIGSLVEQAFVGMLDRRFSYHAV